MGEARIGRVLVASLHQGIADLLPLRLEFYENWLNAEGLREGTIGIAPLHAVLSFLRQEGETYQTVTARAGEYAAVWMMESVPPFERALTRAAPTWVRARIFLRLARRFVRTSYQDSRAVARLRRGTARIDVRASVFCVVREPVPKPLCGFYASAFKKLLEMVNVNGRVDVLTCRGKGEANCVLEVTLPKRGRPAGGEAAA